MACEYASGTLYDNDCDTDVSRIATTSRTREQTVEP